MGAWAAAGEAPGPVLRIPQAATKPGWGAESAGGTLPLEGKELKAEEAPSPAETPAVAPSERLSPSAGAENKGGPAVFSMETCVPRCSFPAEYFPRITSRRRVHRMGVGVLQI